MLASLVVHGAVLAAALYWAETDRHPGAIPEPSEAVSLAMYQSDVLEAVDVSQTVEATASLASVQAEEGAEHDAAAPAEQSNELEPLEPQAALTAEDVPLAEATEPAPKGIEALSGALAVEEVTGRDVTDTQDHPREITPPVKKPAERKKVEKRVEPAPRKTSKTAPSRKGGAKSKASKSQKASSGRVSASRGSAINYAAKVRARVASRRPGGAGQRGTVVVSFGVSSSGGLAYARIARSSGNGALDRRVLSAVRGAAPFPSPPPGATRQFSIPFYFR